VTVVLDRGNSTTVSRLQELGIECMAAGSGRQASSYEERPSFLMV
jgi:hypothetical protein